MPALGAWRRIRSAVMAGLVPAIHVERRRNAVGSAERRRVDARHKAGHDVDRIRIADCAGKFAKPSCKRAWVFGSDLQTSASASRNCAKSSGNSLSNSISSPVTGCAKPSVAACSAWRPRRSTISRAAGAKLGDLGLEARAIGFIADQRMADMGHMHADLMRAAGLQLTAQERGHAVILDLLPMGDGFAPARF